MTNKEKKVKRMLKVLHKTTAGQFYVTIAQAIKMESDVVTDPKGNKAVSTAEVQEHIEQNSVKALATDGRGTAYYNAEDLEVPQEKLM